MLQDLHEVDNIEVITLMDNVSDPFTVSHHGMRWNEFQYQFGVNDNKAMNGSDLCRACTGLSLFIKVFADGKQFNLLFDTGPDDGLVAENAKRLKIDLNTVDAVFLSHGHYDHYGGLISVLKAINKPGIPVFTHPDLFSPRAFMRGDNQVIPVNYNLTEEIVEKNGGKIVSSNEPELIFDNCILMSGEVLRVTNYEAGAPNALQEVDGKWMAAPEVIDERTVIFKLKDKGLCVFTGCGHTGVINAVKHAKTLTGLDKIHLVMGGFHLAGPAYEDRIEPTVNDFKTLQPDFVITGHCTGAKAQAALASALGDKHIPYGVATVFRF